MSASYQFILLYRDSKKLAILLEESLRAELTDLRITKDVVEILHNGNVTSLTEEAVKLAVFLGDDKAATDNDLLRKVEQLQEMRIPVVPLLGDGEFVSSFPPALHPINALRWRADDPGATTVQLLRLAGLTEKHRRIFVSYRRTDALMLGEDIWTSLSQAGFDVFLDRFCIEPLADFQARLTDELNNKSFVLIIESPEVNESKWVLHEVHFARLHRLGILVLTLPETVQKSKKIPGLYDKYRHLLNDRDLRSEDGKLRLTKEFKERLPGLVERRHAAAMLRRRRQLLGSILQEASRRSLKTTQLSDWTVLIMGKLNSSPRLVSVLPRPPEVPDLWALDRSRPESRNVSHSWLVHAASYLSTEQDELLNWAIGSRDITVASEDQIVTLLNRLEQEVST